MNWFAIGAGIALIAVGIGGLTHNPPGGLPRSAAITLGLVGLVFLFLGASESAQ